MKLAKAVEIEGAVTKLVQAIDIHLGIDCSPIAVFHKLHDFSATIVLMGIQLPLHLLYIAKPFLLLI